MRRPLIFTAIFTFALCGSLNARAQTDPSFVTGQQAIDPYEIAIQPLDEQTMIDRMAGDFFENSLRYSQAKRIETETAAHYQAMTPEERAAFRDQRRQMWRAMNEAQRQSLRNAKTPLYLGLSEDQKRPFRDIALEQLKARPTADEQLYTGQGGI